ncbi:Uncharacterised protein [Escherichia coli]|nr:Uncharacterised protein [Escherichia coli]
MFEIAYSRITFYDSATHGMAPKNKTLYPWNERTGHTHVGGLV